MIIFKPHLALEYIAPAMPINPIIVEAGAFTGSDTIRMAEMFPHGFIHAFEPVPELFEKLIHRTKDYTNIRCYPYGLSNQTGFAPFYISEKPDRPGIACQAGSLLEPKERLKYSSIIFPRTIQVPVTTLDEWSIQHNISHVDLLWLDMQGNELAVLQSSRSILPTVRAIYTEVPFIESYKEIPSMSDITTWITSHNFELIGQDFEDTTQHFFGNRLFIKKQ